MAKVDDARLNALKALFETDDTISQITVWDLLDAIQEAAQDHEHSATGGPGSGTGDATLANAGELEGYDVADTAPALGDLLRYQGDPLKWRPDGAMSAGVYNVDVISIPHNSWTTLTFNAELWDTDDLHSIGTNPERLSVPIPGPYLVTAHISFAANAIGRRGLRIVAGSTIIASTIKRFALIMFCDVSVSTLWWMSAVGYFTCQAYQNSGGALNVRVVSAYSPEFRIARIA